MSDFRGVRLLFKLLVLSLVLPFAACDERAPVFLEVSVEDGQAPLGVFEMGFRALVRGSEPLSVNAYVSTVEGELSSGQIGSCQKMSLAILNGRGSRQGEPSALFPQQAVDTPDAGVLLEQDEQSLQSTCTFTKLKLDISEPLTGSLFSGQATSSFAGVGQPFYYRLRAKGAGGVTWWPSSGEERVIVEGIRSPLVVSHISPDHGPATGVTQVLIRGKGFSAEAPTSLTLDGFSLTDIIVESPHLISATTSAGPPKTQARLVMTSAGRRAELADAFFWDPPPQIDEVVPSEFPSEQSTQVSLVGEYFVKGTSGISGSTSLVYELPSEMIPTVDLLDEQEPLGEVIVRTDRFIEVTLPPGASGKRQLVVRNPDGQVDSILIIRRAAPELISVTPDRGPDTPPTWILIEGKELRLPASVWFGDRPALDIGLNEEGTLARVLTPLHPGGITDVIWYNPDGQSSRLDNAYRFVGPPRVQEAEPRILSRCGRGLTTLFGVNLSENMTVFFNGIEGEVVSVNEEGTEAIVRAPPGGQPEGTIELVLIAPDGRRSQRNGLLRFGIQPLVESIEPALAPVWGGTRARLRGSDLVVGSQFIVGGRLVERANFIADGCTSLVEVTLPEGEEGFQPLEVTSPNGGLSLLPDAVNYVMPTFEPAEGLTAGYTNLTLTGLDLREGLRITFNGFPPRRIVRISDEAWVLVTPEMTVGAVEVEIRNNDGRGILSNELFSANHFIDQGAESLGATGECNHVSQGDFDGDGITDIVLAMGASSPVGVINQTDLLYSGDGVGLSPPRDLWVSGNGMNVYAEDIDVDGDLDLLIVNLFSEQNFLLINDGTGQFNEDLSFPAVALGPSYDAGIFDADLDGDLDLFFMQTGDVSDNQVFGPERLFLQDNEGWTERSQTIDFDLDDVHDHDMAHGDLNGDGLEDVVIVVDNLPQSFPGNSNRILINQGNGEFTRVESLINNYPGDWLDVALADLNGDGHLDILMPQDYIEGVSVVGTPSIAIFMGDGTGSFTDESFRSAVMPPVPAYGITPYDIDQDQDVDLLIAVYGVAFGDGSVEPFQSVLLLNDGQGEFFGGNRAFNRVPFIPSSHFEVIDLDRDGRFDMVECAAEGESRIWRQSQEDE